MIFVDTGPLLARYLAQDQFHRKAMAAWSRLQDSHERCVTSNFVLDEFFTLLARRASYAFAADRARNILSSQAFTILRPTHEDETAAVDLFAKYADQKVSFTDCISFVLIRQAKIKHVFSFDRHFKHTGLRLYPA